MTVRHCSSRQFVSDEVSPDLDRVGQAAAGAVGMTHSVQSFTGEPRRTLHHAVDFHVGHVGGHYERCDALAKRDQKSF